MLDVAPIGPFAPSERFEFGNLSYYNQISNELEQLDVPSLITVRDPAAAERLRDELIDFLWKGAGFPWDAFPYQIETDVASPLGKDYPNLPNVARIDRWTVGMDYGLRSHVYAFHPEESSNRLLIWHQGHDSDLGATGGFITMASFLDQGFTVLAVWMPLLGENQIAEPIQVGECTLTGYKGHEEFACAETEDFTPLKYFIEPVAAALNFALKEGAFEDVVMAGISGGGWTTTVYAALDPRVRVSIPVAGTLPSYLKAKPYLGDFGDWEQSYSAFYERVDYLDLYVLGSYGPGRRQLQVLNKFDDCCFAGVRFRTYLDHVKDAVAKLGEGSFTVFLDDSLRPFGSVASHNVSYHALTTAIFHEVAGSGVQFVDDGTNTYWNGGGTDRSTFHTHGLTFPRSGRGLGNDATLLRRGDGTSRVTWQFQVVPGRYRVALTWDSSAAEGIGFASFTLREGKKQLDVIQVDQRLMPGDFFDGMVGWYVLGEYNMFGTQLLVELVNNFEGVVIADGVRIEFLGQNIPGPEPTTFPPVTTDVVPILLVSDFPSMMKRRGNG